MNHIARWSVALTLLLFGATVDIAKAQNAGTLAATPASPSLSAVDYNFVAQANLGAPFQVDSGRLGAHAPQRLHDEVSADYNIASAAKQSRRQRTDSA